ncbi:MAG: cofactor assembly of complex C subunit B [Cyanobacteria bacterium J06627_28]
MFSDPTRASTLLLTALMVIGLVFFIRASTKDRIETMQFESTEAAEPLRKAVMQYFQSRAYRQVVDSDKPAKAIPEAGTTNDSKSSAAAEEDIVTVSGQVSPSVFMAGFLSLLAAVGLACLALILVMLSPGLGAGLFGLVAISPLAGVFYWRKSSRPETVIFKVEPSAVDPSFAATLTVKGHRDEIAELKNAFSPVLKVG